MLEELTKIRRELHQIPEIGYKEFNTSKLVRSYLESYGYECIETAKTGVLALRKGRENTSLAFRSDMDALEVEEKVDVDFKSIHDGYMHACGHDGHMAILLGFAKYISTLKETKKNILFIFQPAEESPGGAKEIIKEGVLERYNVESIFGIHLFPEIEEGKLGITSGPLMAQNAEINIDISARGAHGAMPHLGIDGIYVASQLINAYQSIISRNIDSLEGAIITIGKIEGGNVRNVLAESVRLEGTVRAFNKEVFQLIKSRMFEITKGIEEMYEVKIDFEFIDFYPPVINDENLYQLVKRAVGQEDSLKIKPRMISEDFSFFQEKVPGIFMFLGTRNEEKGYIHPLHSSLFNFDEKVLKKGLEYYIKIAKEAGAI